jgi:hypothetical protein
MMRPRSASVIATLPLLTWTATASAECAWVLWDGSLPSRPGLEMLWNVSGTFSTANECYAELRDEVALRNTLLKAAKGQLITRVAKCAGI